MDLQTPIALTFVGYLVIAMVAIQASMEIHHQALLVDHHKVLPRVQEVNQDRPMEEVVVLEMPKLGMELGKLLVKVLELVKLAMELVALLLMDKALVLEPHKQGKVAQPQELEMDKDKDRLMEGVYRPLEVVQESLHPLAMVQQPVQVKALVQLRVVLEAPQLAELAKVVPRPMAPQPLVQARV